MDILVADRDDELIGSKDFVTRDDLDNKTVVETHVKGLPLITMAVSGLAGIGLFALVFTMNNMFKPRKVTLK